MNKSISLNMRAKQEAVSSREKDFTTSTDDVEKENVSPAEEKWMNNGKKKSSNY